MFLVFKSHITSFYFLEYHVSDREKVSFPLLPVPALIHWSNAQSLLNTGTGDGEAVLKCIGQILAWCHVSGTRRLEFETVEFRLPELTGCSMRSGDKMSLHLAQPHHWALVSSSSSEDGQVQDSLWPASASSTRRHPPPPPHKSCGHWHAKRFRSVVGVAYPLTGALFLISHASADCVSSVGKLQSHPRCVYVTCTCEFIRLPSEERRSTCWESTPRTWTWSFLHERYVKRRVLTAKRCRTKLELTVSLHINASLILTQVFVTCSFSASSTSSPLYCCNKVFYYNHFQKWWLNLIKFIMVEIKWL